jgi:hypothetical protein
MLQFPSLPLVQDTSESDGVYLPTIPKIQYTCRPLIGYYDGCVMKDTRTYPLDMYLILKPKQFKNVFMEYYRDRKYCNDIRDMTINVLSMNTPERDRWLHFAKGCAEVFAKATYVPKAKILTLNYGKTTKLGTRVVLDALDMMTGGGLSLYNCLRHYLVKSNAAKGVEAINKYITLTGERFNVPHDLTVLYITLLMGSIPERNPFINEKAIGEAKSSYDLLVELGRLSGPFGTKLSINLLGKDCGKTEIDEILKLIIGKI